MPSGWTYEASFYFGLRILKIWYHHHCGLCHPAIIQAVKGILFTGELSDVEASDNDARLLRATTEKNCRTCKIV